MKQIETTETRLQKLKQLAKERQKASGKLLAVELDAIAIEWGYFHWKHVTLCRAATAKEQLADQRQKELEAEILAGFEPHSRAIFDKQSPEQQKFWLFQLYKETPEGKARFRPVYSEITTSWKNK